jgi:hypothetical protein
MTSGVIEEDDQRRPKVSPGRPVTWNTRAYEQAPPLTPGFAISK